MDKINSGFFDVSKRKFDFLNVRVQPKLFVNVPKKTQVKGNTSCAIKFKRLFTLYNFLVQIKFLNLT